jgi:hypothetical protein
VTLADGVLKARARSLRPPAGPPTEPRPSRYRWDPLRSMMHRGSARLRHDIQAEDTIRHAAVRAAAPEGAAGTRAAAEKALRLTREAALAAGLIELRHGLWSRPGSMELLEVEPPPAEDGPQQAQAP